jgi:hypothetical protein
VIRDSFFSVIVTSDWALRFITFWFGQMCDGFK